MGGYFVPIISWPGVGTIFAVEIGFPRVAESGATGCGESKSGHDGRAAEEAPAARAMAAVRAAVSPGGVLAVAIEKEHFAADDETAALLALISGTAQTHGVAGPPDNAVVAAAAALPLRTPVAAVEVRCTRVMLVEDDAFVVAVARGT
jgi:hypothetical protein